MKFPDIIRKDTVYVSTGFRVEVSTIKTQYGYFETLLFPEHEVNGKWYNAPNSRYYQVGMQFDTVEEVLDYHSSWLDYLHDEDENNLPQYRNFSMSREG